MLSEKLENFAEVLTALENGLPEGSTHRLCAGACVEMARLYARDAREMERFTVPPAARVQLRDLPPNAVRLADARVRRAVAALPCDTEPGGAA
jgi:hypothetical protein